MTVLLNILSWQGNGEMGKQLTLWVGCILRPFSCMLNLLIFVIPMDPHFFALFTKAKCRKTSQYAQSGSKRTFPSL